MYVCVCNAVTDSDIRKAAEAGVTSMEHLQVELKVGACCGRCKNCAKRILNDACDSACAMNQAGAFA